MADAPVPLSDEVRARLKGQRQRDTRPELALRRELHRRGLRFRVELKVLDNRRRHDIVFTRARVVVEVHGCFWHSCPIHGSLPKNNRAWWQEKLAANRARDADTVGRLQAAGWTVLTFWEHDDVITAADEVEKAVRAHRPSPA